MVPVSPICSVLLQEVLDFFVIHFFESLQQFIPCSHKFVAMSDQMDLTADLFAINFLGARMKKVASKAFVTFICMTRQVKHVNNAQYLFNCELLSLMGEGPNISTPQYVKGRTSVHLSTGRLAIF